jgi:hypothetical protein
MILASVNKISREIGPLGRPGQSDSEETLLGRPSMDVGRDRKSEFRSGEGPRGLAEQIAEAPKKAYRPTFHARREEFLDGNRLFGKPERRTKGDAERVRWAFLHQFQWHANGG